MFIKVKNLTKSYKSGEVSTQVLKGVEMELDQGEIGVILGPSGSGKTTLLNIIGGIDRSDKGIVTVDNIEVTTLSDNKLTDYRREMVGFIFQFYNLIPNLTVGENVEVVSNISKSPIAVDEVLAAVGMADKKHRFPKELSGGEQQRVSIARAVVKNPKLLLCDEPTGALDYITSREILKLLQKINKEFGTTILMITHNPAISTMANRVYRVRSGEIVESVKNITIMPAERIEW
ncbi:MAG: transporter ATP-binding protein [Herbinix sp.]|nr:transporter ATP-binding protein [Herbinix sp.]